MLEEWISNSIKRKLEKQIVFCVNCNKPETLRFGKEYTTYKCGCGVTIYYPPNEERPFSLRRFVSKKEYLKNKELKDGKGKTGIPTADN